MIGNTETERFKNLNTAVPILKICPGKLSKTLRREDQKKPDKLDRKSSTFRTSFSDQSTIQRCPIFEIRISNFELNKDGLRHFKNLPPNTILDVSWDLYDFPTSHSTQILYQHESTIFFDCSTMYRIKKDQELLEYLEENPISFRINIIKSNADDVVICSGEIQLQQAVSKARFKIPGTVEMYEAMSSHQKPPQFGTLSIWYKLDYEKRIISSADYHKSYAETAAPRRSTLSYSSVNITPKSSFMANYLPRSRVQVTESEIEDFQEALDLVLNRNKALRTTQSEITNELEDRAEWLKEEAIWQRTLQEYAILSGKSPYDVSWRQWRDEDTANVSLRHYPHQPIIYIPELRITIMKLKFYPDSSIYVNDNITQFFVEYSFLNREGPEYETPTSLPKPEPNEYANIYFTKIFPMDIKKNRRNCEFIAEMIRSKASLKLNVVSEPEEDFNVAVQTCEEIGYAEINFFDLVQSEENKDRSNYTIIDSSNPEYALGHLKVEIEGVMAMRRMALLMLAPKSFNIIV